MPDKNKIIFTDEWVQPENLHPFTLTRHTADIRVGILTIRQKWETTLKLPSYNKKVGQYKDILGSVTLQEAIPEKGYVIVIQGNILPTPSLVNVVKKLQNGEFITVNEKKGVIYRVSKDELDKKGKIKVKRAVPFSDEVKIVEFPWNIFQLNDWAIKADFLLLTKNRKTQVLDKSVTIVGKKKDIFIEKGARIKHCVLNTETGPIYIGKNAEVMEGALIRGPFSLGEKAVVKMGAKIYGATTIGPSCVVAGEIKNSVLFGYSNKAHDGYLGDSVMGEWCNLGAGTTNSNLKNNAKTVKVWTPSGIVNAGNKCGMMVGDYSRTAINSSINTGSVIGVCANLFGVGLTVKYIPNFSWGGDGLVRYNYEKALEDINGWKALKNHALKEEEKVILRYIFENY